jgi:hypothetical protein
MEILPTWIPRIQYHHTVYKHFPICEMSREEAESILKQPPYHRSMILRTSHNARKINPDLYYVVTYFIPNRVESVNTIVTRACHEKEGGILTPLLLPLLAYLESEVPYSLLIRPHHSFYQMTQVYYRFPAGPAAPPALAPQPLETVVKSEEDNMKTTEE